MPKKKPKSKQPKSKQPKQQPPSSEKEPSLDPSPPLSINEGLLEMLGVHSDTPIPYWPPSFPLPLHMVWSTMVVERAFPGARIRHCYIGSTLDSIRLAAEAERDPELCLIVDVSSPRLTNLNTYQQIGLTNFATYRQIGLLKNFPKKQRSVCLFYNRDNYAVCIATTPQYRRQSQKSIRGLNPDRSDSMECMVCFADGLVYDAAHPERRLSQCPFAHCTAVYCQVCLEENLGNQCLQCKARVVLTLRPDGMLSTHLRKDQDEDFFASAPWLRGAE